MNVGTARTRVEAPVKVTGAAKYSADHYPPGTLHATMVGAPIANGRIVAIDTARASQVPGVVRILLAKDMPRFGKIGPPASVLKPPMQDDWIEWEGQAVAIVLGETLEAAEEAAALVRVSTAAQPPMVPGKGKLEAPPRRGEPAKDEKGNVTAGLASATATISESYFQPTRHHNPMETSGTVAVWEGDKLTIWNSTQATFNAPVAIAAALGVKQSDIRQIAPHTGGGFGAKGGVWPHEILAAAAARVTGRPVRLHLTRSQMYQVGHQPEFRQVITLGATADGKLTAIRHEAINTTSASDTHSEAPTASARGSYACPNIAVDHQLERINFGVPCPMRAPVEGPGSWAFESAMDELAVKLGIDPLDLRLANHAEVHPMDGRPWSSNKLREAYAEADQAYGWRTRRSRPRQDGVWQIGHGLGRAGMFCARMGNSARVRVRGNGRVTIEAGSNDIGTGQQTLCMLVAADALGIDPGSIDMRWGDTGLPKTSGVYGSSHTMGLGSAVLFASRDVRRKLAAFGATPEGPLDLASIMGRAGVAEVTGEGSFDGHAADFGERPDLNRVAPASPYNLNGQGTPYAMQTFGVTMVEVGVDPDLGLIRLRRAVARYSAGKIINPLTARSQMIGGIIWEWGKATMEASVIEPRYGRFLAKNLSNVALPVNADIPSAIDVGFVDEDDRRASAIGAKGIGELGSTGVTAAIANAIYDAVGVRVRQVPILPSHILDGLEGGAAAQA